MSEEVVTPPAEAAPESVETASTDAAPVSGENTPVETKESKSFTQEELDEIVSKRLAKAQRKWEREHAQKPVAETPKADSEPQKPDVKNFTTDAEYATAMEKYADEKVAYREAKKAEEERLARTEKERKALISAHADREDDATEKYEDYHVVTRNPKLVVTDAMLDAIVTSDIGPEIAYHLGKNPEESKRIAKLPVIAQAKEIGKLEATLAAKPPKKSSLPPPINPLKGSGPSASADPSDGDSMAVWLKKREAHLRAKRAKGASR